MMKTRSKTRTCIWIIERRCVGVHIPFRHGFSTSARRGAIGAPDAKSEIWADTAKDQITRRPQQMIRSRQRRVRSDV